MSGNCTLTANSWPSLVAWWTWAREAAATGFLSKVSNLIRKLGYMYCGVLKIAQIHLFWLDTEFFNERAFNCLVFLECGLNGC